jgi:3-hydroxyisobutyrate dehydrogenase-like beta-hydroxyacid dehydrogenase
MTFIAFLGLGRMGGRMAPRLLEAGHELVVWNRTAEKRDPLVGAGAKPAESPADAARGAEIVITMLADSAALRAVTEGPNGIAAAVDDGSTCIEMSTVGPSAIAWLRSALPHGAGLLDAPVLGSLAEAESGSLHIFVGGPPELADRWIPLLSTMGEPIRVGPLGSGAGAKLVANSTLLGVLGVLGEALALADGLGLSRDVAFEVLARTPLAAQAERRRPALESGDFPPRFSMSLARKDAQVITEEAAASGVELRVLRAAREWFAEAETGGWRDRDYSAVLAWIIERAGRDRS